MNPDIAKPIPQQKQSFPPVLFIVLAALLWSTGGVFIKKSGLSTLEISFGRSLLAAITVALLTRHLGFGFNRMTAVKSLLYAALLVLFVIATKKTTSANAIFLQYTAPIYVLIFEPLLFREKFRLFDAVVVGVCVVGMSLFFFGKLKPDDVVGNVAALASGVCLAFYILLLRHPLSQSVNRASSVIYGNLIVVVVAAVALALAPSLRQSAGDLKTRDIAIVLYLGVVQIGVAYALFTLGIARGVRSLEAGIVGYIEPVLNPIWVFLFVGERPSMWALAGGIIIIAAVFTHMILGARRAQVPNFSTALSPHET